MSIEPIAVSIKEEGFEYIFQQWHHKFHSTMEEVSDTKYYESVFFEVRINDFECPEAEIKKRVAASLRKLKKGEDPLINSYVLGYDVDYCSLKRMTAIANDILHHRKPNSPKYYLTATSALQLSKNLDMDLDNFPYPHLNLLAIIYIK